MKYDLDVLTAENGSVLGNLVENTSPASLAISPDLAEELRLKIKQVNASLAEGARNRDIVVRGAASIGQVAMSENAQKIMEDEEH